MKFVRLYLIIFTGIFIICTAGCYKPKITMSKAVLTGDKKAVEYYIKHGEDVNQKDKEGVPLILSATIRGYTDIVNILIKAGADVNAQNTYGYTALTEATWHNNSEITKILIKAGANVNGMPLLISINRGDIENINSLIAAGADINTSVNGITPVTMATSNGNTEIVNILIKAGADISWENNKDMETALNSAIVGNHTETVNTLIKAGVDFNNLKWILPILEKKSNENDYSEMIDILKKAIK